jgi:hypothetical protein
VASIERRICHCFSRNASILPQGMRVTWKIHTQDFASVPDASGNKQALGSSEIGQQNNIADRFPAR